MAETKSAADAAKEVEHIKTTSGAGPGGKSFVFIGDAKGDGPKSITLFGATFEKNGKPVEVKDPEAIKKLTGNSHFKAA